MHCRRPCAMFHEGTTNRTFMSHKFSGSSHFPSSGLFFEKITLKDVEHYLQNLKTNYEKINFRTVFLNNEYAMVLRTAKRNKYFFHEQHT